MQFPSKLPRRMAGSVDPVDIFREIAELPCVTFNEYLVYEYLLDEVEHLRRKLVDWQSTALACQFTEAGQLLVSWRGRPDDASRSVLVAHVDREGLLVRSFNANKTEARCWHTSANAPEALKGSRVRLYTSGQVMYGQVQDVSSDESLEAEEPFAHEITVRIDHQSRASNVRVFRNDQFEGFGHYDIPPYSIKDGMISATHVDNVAGVSILVSLLNILVRNSWRANVDFLFTTCEEAGFCGMVAEIISGKQLVSGAGGEVVCIVVDSSSHVAFSAAKESWAGRQDGQSMEEVPLQHPVIRTADKGARFNPEVTHLLSAAARNLQAAPTRYDRIQWTGKKKASVSDRLRESLRNNLLEGDLTRGDSQQKADEGLPGSMKPAAVVGQMRGGYCEAFPLTLQAEIRNAYAELAPLHLRVGAVAVPIANYRNYFKKGLNPEKCHQSALRGVRDLIGEAVMMIHRWPFGIAAVESYKVDHQEQIVQRLLARQNRYADLLSVSKEWIRQNGSSAEARAQM